MFRHSLQIHSPLGLIIQPVYNSEKTKKHDIKTIQFTNPDFMDYQSAAKSLQFNAIPYKKVTHLKMSKSNLDERVHHTYTMMKLQYH